MTTSAHATTAITPTAQGHSGLRVALELHREERLRQLAELDAVPTAELGLVAAAHRDAVRRLLEETDAALDRMDNGRFGECLGCRRAIPVERLELVPHAAYCVGCASARAGVDGR